MTLYMTVGAISLAELELFETKSNRSVAVRSVHPGMTNVKIEYLESGDYRVDIKETATGKMLTSVRVVVDDVSARMIND